MSAIINHGFTQPKRNMAAPDKRFVVLWPVCDLVFLALVLVLARLPIIRSAMLSVRATGTHKKTGVVRQGPSKALRRAARVNTLMCACEVLKVFFDNCLHARGNSRCRGDVDRGSVCFQITPIGYATRRSRDFHDREYFTPLWKHGHPMTPTGRYSAQRPKGQVIIR